MENIEPADVAIVFWTHGPRGTQGEVTRFDSLDDALHSIMEQPAAKSASVAWIRTADRHLTMDDIRQMARRRTLASRLARVSLVKVEGGELYGVSGRLSIHRGNPGGGIRRKIA